MDCLLLCQCLPGEKIEKTFDRRDDANQSVLHADDDLDFALYEAENVVL